MENSMVHHPYYPQVNTSALTRGGQTAYIETIDEYGFFCGNINGVSFKWNRFGRDSQCRKDFDLMSHIQDIGTDVEDAEVIKSVEQAPTRMVFNSDMINTFVELEKANKEAALESKAIEWGQSHTGGHMEKTVSPDNSTSGEDVSSKAKYGSVMIENADGTKIWYQNGKPHREDGPAVERSNGTKEWYQNGILHREDGPAVEYADGAKEWYQNGKRHREDGPAIERSNGTKEWYQNGILHREDGPAVERSSGTKEWYQNGKPHREDGPVVEYAGGPKEYCIDGVKQPTPVVKKSSYVPKAGTFALTSKGVKVYIVSVTNEQYGIRGVIDQKEHFFRWNSDGLPFVEANDYHDVENTIGNLVGEWVDPEIRFVNIYRDYSAKLHKTVDRAEMIGEPYNGMFFPIARVKIKFVPGQFDV